MIHGLHLSEGNANWYRNRYVQTPMKAQPGIDPFAGIGDLTKSMANTHVVHHAGKILALEELHHPYEITPELETVGSYDFGGALHTGMTAHPKTCADTGEMLFFGYDLEPPYITYHRVSADGVLVQSEPIDVPGATMVHDFNITRNFVIFMDLPVVFDLAAAEVNGFPIQWSDDYGARLGVMPRNGTNADVVWYNIDPCYVFHPVNAYEDGDKIVIDVSRTALTMKPGHDEAPYMLTRWTINQTTGSVVETQLDDHSADFGRVADTVVGQPYRYGYLAQFGTGDNESTIGIRKYDLSTDTSALHELKNGRSCGEPVFVPRANAAAEDDGYLLSFVHDPRNDKSELVIFDAANITDDPVASIHLNSRVPAGFHGTWIPEP
jgi:carotenoid cleavage dioxygenase-like enzyme